MPTRVHEKAFTASTRLATMSHSSATTAAIRLLLVASKPMPRALVQQLAELLPGLHIDHVKAGRDAIKRVCEGASVHVLLIDSMLGDMSACEFCQQLATVVQAPQPVLVLGDSAELAAGVGTSALHDGLSWDHVPYPIDGHVLANRLIVCARLSGAERRTRINASELTQLRRERAELRGNLTRLQTRDPDTGLFNSSHFNQYLRAITTDAPRLAGALIIIHLDRFRHLLSLLGEHATGETLQAISLSLKCSFGPSAVLARLGANEFAALMPDVSSNEAAVIGEQLRLAVGALSEQLVDISIGVSIGIASLGDAVDDGMLITQARRAAYVARQRGGNLVHVFHADDPELEDQRSTTLWGSRIRHALKNGGFRLVFQPVMRICDGVIDHYEVLVRMLGERGQLLPPPQFIPIAERTGLIHDIDRWVVGASIGLLQRLAPVQPKLHLNINLSGRAFQDALLLPFICERFESSGVDPHRITFEITETAAIANISSTRAMVNQLRALGCQFALDDFGAGFASYSYLKQLPVDVLKIDGAFISNLANDPMDQVLVRSMVDIAKRLGKRTVAEFVGDQETLRLLGEYGVDYAQGYFIGKPSGAILPARQSMTDAPQLG